MGEMIVSVYGDHAMRTKFTQYFNAPQYDCREKPDEYVPSKYLDREGLYYDIRKRNDIILKSDLDDSDFDF